MDMNSAFPSDYLRASDLNGDTTVAMDRVEMVELGSEHKPVLHFVGCDKGLVLNKTNTNTICGLYGPSSEAWQGQKVTLFPTQTDYQGRQVECIRVRVGRPAPAVPATDSGREDGVPF